MTEQTTGRDREMARRVLRAILDAVEEYLDEPETDQGAQVDNEPDPQHVPDLEDTDSPTIPNIPYRMGDRADVVTVSGLEYRGHGVGREGVVCGAVG